MYAVRQRKKDACSYIWLTEIMKTLKIMYSVADGQRHEQA